MVPGVARSTPGVTFFETEAEAALWWKQIPSAANRSNEGIARPWAQGRLLGQLAIESDDGSLRHIKSENTARDMLSIVEAHGQEKLQYLGFSYVTDDIFYIVIDPTPFECIGMGPSWA
jgi:hypothetical protein